MSRTVMRQAAVVLVVGAPGMKGVHSLARVVGDLAALGVPGSRVVPVVNRAPRSRRWRAELAAAFGALVGSAEASTSLASPIFLPERRIEECLRDGVRLPSQMTAPVTAAVRAVLMRDGRRRGEVVTAERVAPGSIGHWAYDDTGDGADAGEALG